MSDEVNGVPLEKMFGAIAKVKEKETKLIICFYT